VAHPAVRAPLARTQTVGGAAGALRARCTLCTHGVQCTVYSFQQFAHTGPPKIDLRVCVGIFCGACMFRLSNALQSSVDQS
jgi:hypothetical protein